MSRTNVLILGKSGCGKSSLLNYLWGDALAKVGSGRPVTPKSNENFGTCGIYPFPPVIRNGLEVVIHDSWGMEADKADEWRRLIEKETRRREISGNVSDWFHSVLYCISAKGARIEKFEIDSIIKPLVAQGYSVIFILTKSDIASENERHALREILEKEFPINGGIIEVCNVNQKLRNGSIKQAFGSEMLLQGIMLGLRRNLINMIKRQYIIQCRNKSDNWRYDLLSFYEQEAGFFKLKNYSTVLEEITERAQIKHRKMIEEIRLWLNKSTHEAELIFKSFGIQFASRKFLDDKVSASHFDNSEIADGFRLDSSEKIAHVILSLVPLLNILIAVSRKDTLRDDLDKKFCDVVLDFMGASEAAVKLIDNYLAKTMLLPEKSEVKIQNLSVIYL